MRLFTKDQDTPLDSLDNIRSPYFDAIFNNENTQDTNVRDDEGRTNNAVIFLEDAPSDTSVTCVQENNRASLIKFISKKVSKRAFYFNFCPLLSFLPAREFGLHYYNNL